MITEDTGLIGIGGRKVYKMKNITTKEVGLVLAGYVAKKGTLDAEKYYTIPMFRYIS